MKYFNEEIIKLNNELGFELIGFCKLKHFKDLEKILNLQYKLGFKTNFQKGGIDDKAFKYTKYKSAIVCGLRYNKLRHLPRGKDAFFSSCAVGMDYHDVIKNKLERLRNILEKNGYSAFIGADNNIYDEKFLAYKAGLGFYGKNGLIINESYGSLFFIGIVLTDAVFKYNKPSKKTCDNCDKCLNACPTKAINKTKILNGNKCLSYLTQKKDITEDEKAHFNNGVYGCDKCLNACPYNVGLDECNNFISEGIEFINTNEFLKMSPSEYKSKYKMNSSFWRGKKIIDRNINIYKANKLKKKNSYAKIGV